jgi:hypothetical protein
MKRRKLSLRNGSMRKSEKVMAGIAGILLVIAGHQLVSKRNKSVRANPSPSSRGSLTDAEVKKAKGPIWSLLQLPGVLPIADIETNPFVVPQEKKEVETKQTIEDGAPVLQLQGVLGDALVKYAVINGQVIALGETIQGMEVENIEEDEVALRKGKVRLVLRVHPRMKPGGGNGQDDNRGPKSVSASASRGTSPSARSPESVN